MLIDMSPNAQQIEMRLRIAVQDDWEDLDGRLAPWVDLGPTEEKARDLRRLQLRGRGAFEPSHSCVDKTESLVGERPQIRLDPLRLEPRDQIGPIGLVRAKLPQMPNVSIRQVEQARWDVDAVRGDKCRLLDMPQNVPLASTRSAVYLLRSV